MHKKTCTKISNSWSPDKGLSVNRCSVDFSTIKNTSSKQQICLKIPPIGVVEVFNMELHLQFHFLGFSRNTRSTLECLLFIFVDCNMSNKNVVFLSSKFQATCTFFLQTDYFKCNWPINFPGETVVDIVFSVSENSHSISTVKFLVKLQSAKMGFVNSFRLKFCPDFLNSKKLSRGDLQE